MSESPTGVITDTTVGIQTESSIPQIKKGLFDPRTISKIHDQEGRNKLASTFWDIKKEGEDRKKEEEIAKTQISETELELQKRRENFLVKIRQKLKIPDEQTTELQTQLLTLKTKPEQDHLPDPKQMVEAYYEKVAETPLTNQEKRDLLKPEVVRELSTDEFIALWKRLNPYFLSHVTRQGFRDHNAMVYHSAGMREFSDGFIETMNDEKLIRPPFSVNGLKGRDEGSVKIFLSSWVLQADTEEEARMRFDSTLHISLASAPKYPDKTAVHFTNELVSDDMYGAETRNEIFYIIPSDIIASQYTFTFNGGEKGFIKSQSEDKWNDIFVWPSTLENPGVSIDLGIVFLPKSTSVDRETGSRYASEVRVVDGKGERIMVEDVDLINKFMTWANSITGNDELSVILDEYKLHGYSGDELDRMKKKLSDAVYTNLQKVGINQSMAFVLSRDFNLNSMWYFKGKDATPEGYKGIIDGSLLKYKTSENCITAEEYWENFFNKNPNLRPKRVFYYDGDPTAAVYQFLQQNGIGAADTSKTDGQLLGFDDHCVADMANDPRVNRGHQELIDLGNKIITEHYASR